MQSIERSRSRREWADHLIEVLKRDDTSQHVAASSLLHLFVDATHGHAIEELLRERLTPRWAEGEQGPYAVRYVRRDLVRVLLRLKRSVSARTLAGLRGFLEETHYSSFETMEHFTDQLDDLLELARNSGFHHEGEAILASCELSVTELLLTEDGWFRRGDATAVITAELRRLLYRRWVDAGRLEPIAWSTLDFPESRALVLSGDVDLDRLHRALPEFGPHADAVLEGRPDLREMSLRALSLPLSLLREYPDEVLRSIVREVVGGIRPNGRFDHFSYEDRERLYRAGKLIVGFEDAAAELDALLEEVEPMPVRASIAADRARVSPLCDFDALRAELVEAVHGFVGLRWTRPLCRWAARQSDPLVRFEGLSKLLEFGVANEDPEVFRPGSFCDEPLARTMALGGLAAGGDRAASRQLVELAKQGEVVQRALALRALRLSSELPDEYLALAHAALADHETVDGCMPAVREGALSLSKRPGLDEAALSTLTTVALETPSCSRRAFETAIATWTGSPRPDRRYSFEGGYDFARAFR